ncbi:hypothetical protein SAMN06297251_115101 [Fulvimarina manganoxydans]|uniref:Pyridine nucleotide-disulphide oxidoreductase n=1 Tax=Fulvimarina manganoxydans TaxID=937218 RepID=A0A1W2DKT6_9HYPH|nr:hypothetical protein SAMN06297251_115101 [Fulvimarina manganoxydans]
MVTKRAVLASGSYERPIAFGGNDRPGVMLASAVRTYLNRYGVAPGRRVAIFTTSDDGWQTARDCLGAGIEVSAIVDVRPEVSQQLYDFAVREGVRRFVGAEVVATSGRQALSAMTVIDKSGELHEIATDCLAVSGGFNPNLYITTHLGGRPKWSDAIHAFTPGSKPSHIHVAGAANGEFSLAGAFRSGAEAGLEAARDL